MEQQEQMTHKEYREYISGQNAYYNGMSYEDIAGVKSPERSKEYIQGYKDAKEEDTINKQ